MDKDSRALFDSLVAKQPHELQEHEIEFLRVRVFYLSPAQLALFGDVLGLNEKREPEEAPKKKKKAE